MSSHVVLCHQLLSLAREHLFVLLDSRCELKKLFLMFSRYKRGLTCISYPFKFGLLHIPPPPQARVGESGS